MSGHDIRLQEIRKIISQLSPATLVLLSRPLQNVAENDSLAKIWLSVNASKWH